MKKALNVMGKIASFLGVTIGMVLVALILTITIIIMTQNSSTAFLPDLTSSTLFVPMIRRVTTPI